MGVNATFINLRHNSVTALNTICEKMLLSKDDAYSFIISFFLATNIFGWSNKVVKM